MFIDPRQPHDAKPIPDAPGYFATPKGYIWSAPKQGTHGGFLRPYLDTAEASTGFYRVTLRIEGRSCKRLLGELVLGAFGFPKPYAWARLAYLDHDSRNNAVSNVYWR